MKKEEIYRIFGEGMARFMARNHYELKDVANMLECSDVAVSTMRSGKTIPRFDKVFTLIEHGMQLDEIFGSELASMLCPKVTPEMFNKLEPIESAKVVQQGLLQILEKLKSGNGIA